MIRFWFAYGLRSREAALDTLTDSFADGEISPCENPHVESYRNKSGEVRWGITLDDM